MNTMREFQFRVKNIASQPTKQPHPKQNYIHVPKQRCDLANKLPKQDASNLNHSYPTNEVLAWNYNGRFVLKPPLEKGSSDLT